MLITPLQSNGKRVNPNAHNLSNLAASDASFPAPSKATCKKAGVLLVSAATFLILSGCAHNVAKPNAAQKWGFWSHIPFTSAWKARHAEQNLQPKTDEHQKALTLATDEAVNEAERQEALLVMQANQATGTNTFKESEAIVAAKFLSKQNVQLHGLPDKPMNIQPLLSTNAAVRDAAYEALANEFAVQQRDLAAIRAVLTKQAQRGGEDAKQESSAAMTWWNFEEWVSKFITAHWFALLLAGYLLFAAGKKALSIYNPVLGEGLNAVEGLGIKGVKTMAEELVQGGENFKQEIEDEFKSQPELVAKIKKIFNTQHERAQSSDTQNAVQTLTIKTP